MILSDFFVYASNVLVYLKTGSLNILTLLNLCINLSYRYQFLFFGLYNLKLNMGYKAMLNIVYATIVLLHPLFLCRQHSFQADIILFWLVSSFLIIGRQIARFVINSKMGSAKGIYNLWSR